MSVDQRLSEWRSSLRVISTQPRPPKLNTAPAESASSPLQDVAEQKTTPSIENRYAALASSIMTSTMAAADPPDPGPRQLPLRDAQQQQQQQPQSAEKLPTNTESEGRHPQASEKENTMKAPSQRNAKTVHFMVLGDPQAMRIRMQRGVSAKAVSPLSPSEKEQTSPHNSKLVDELQCRVKTLERALQESKMASEATVRKLQGEASEREATLKQELHTIATAHQAELEGRDRAMDAAMRDALKEQQSQLEGLREALRAHSKEHGDELRRLRGAEQKALADRSQNDVVQESLVEEVIDLQTKLNQQQVDFKMLKVENVRLTSEITTLKGELISTERSMRDAKNREDSMRAREEELCKEQLHYQEASARLHEEAEKASKRAMEVGAAVVNARKESTAMETRIKDLEKQNKALEIDKQAAEHQLQAELEASFMSEFHVARGSGLSEMQARLSSLDTELKLCVQQRDDALTRVSTLVPELERVQNDRDALAEQLANTAQKAESLHDKCCQQTIELSSLRAVAEGLTTSPKGRRTDWAEEFARIQNSEPSPPPQQTQQNLEAVVAQACEEATAQLRVMQEQERAAHSAELHMLRAEVRAMQERELWSNSDIASNLAAKEASHLAGEVRKWGEQEINKAERKLCIFLNSINNFSKI